MIEEVYKTDNIALINKNINQFYKDGIPKDLDPNGNELTTFYPIVWIDAYLDKEDGYNNTEIKVLLNLNLDSIKVQKIEYSNNTHNRYEQWLNRFDMYNYEIDYITYSNHKKIIYDKNLKKYQIIFIGSDLKNAIFTAQKIEKKVNIVKKWIHKYITIHKLAIRNKKNMLYQYKCLPIYVANEIQNLYDENNW